MAAGRTHRVMWGGGRGGCRSRPSVPAAAALLSPSAWRSDGPSDMVPPPALGGPCLVEGVSAMETRPECARPQGTPRWVALFYRPDKASWQWGAESPDRSPVLYALGEMT